MILDQHPLNQSDVKEKYFFTGANEHAASMRGLSVRKVVMAIKMETKSKDKIC